MTDDMEQFGLSSPRATEAIGIASDSRLIKKWEKAKRKKGAQMLAPEERNPGVVFALSSPRAGSTLLRAMLAGHPALFAPQELHLLPFYSMKQSRKIFRNTMLGRGLQRTFMALKELGAEESAAFIERLSEEDWPIHKVYAHIQELCAPRVLVDKSPSYAAEKDALRHAEEIFHEPKYLHLVRHPYAVIESFIRTGIYQQQFSDVFAFIENLWAVSNANLAAFFQELPPARKHVLRYEDLVRTPEEMMRGVCAFLQIAYDDSLLRPYEGARMLDGINAETVAVGDPNFLQHKGIESGLGEAWRRIKLERPLGEFAARVAQSFGYELPYEETAAPAR